MKILGIETSCDETSAAVINVDKENQAIHLLANTVSSSMLLHSKTGGIIPEVAAREQIKYILPTITQALKTAETTIDAIDAIAVTVGPGLIGSLLVGVETAKTLAWTLRKPIIPVNHLLGHIYANWIDQKNQILFPALAVIVSGGHTDLLYMQNHRKIEWIAGTRDDAAGEAFDKIGRLLHLSYPAGPAIELLAKKGEDHIFRFPRPLLYENTFDFSFSGLKAAVWREVNKLDFLSEQTVCDIAKETQNAIIEVLQVKTFRAVEKYQVKSLVMGGGVAANQTLVTSFKAQAMKERIAFFVPDKSLCTDNAAMIAAAAYFTSEPESFEKIIANPELYFA